MALQKAFFSLTSQSKGQFYFEYQHISGDYRYVIGYACDGSQIAICPFGHSDELYIYPQNGLTVDGGKNKEFKLSLNNSEYTERVGIGIDLDASYIYFVYKDGINAFSYSVTCKDFKIIVRDAIGNFADYISFFLNGFKYNPPFNAQSWESVHKKLTCKVRNNMKIWYLLNILL